MKRDRVYVRIAEDDNFGTASIEQRPFTEPYIREDALLEWAKAVKADPMIPMNIDKVIEKIESL